ncbi:MFS transporter [Nocardioides sp. zg-579]|uniref:MFS transporter n=1 Tax=Nocardioides marmotae TaxID=2663857 RepID=A0A6I3JCB7_9ACTN|nr:MFS transporter [Nocardioides marmotae]MCR6032049.1 MFS transporter [Gordonia jinghuaiqii]MTB95693.1 MFS transporter [Nocardioides marmotae]QKE01098.1 MFS transporter [Nocardioides marmotae]
MAGLHRDRTTWTAYVVLGWFAYLQAAPGLVVPHLRDELELDYATGGLYVTAFAGGSTVAGLLSARLEHALERRLLLSSSVGLMAVGAIGLAGTDTVAGTLGATAIMGLGGGGVLATVQATLADHHGDLRAVALTEANVAASCGYLLLVGALATTSALGADWRLPLLISLLVPVATWWQTRGPSVDAVPPRAAQRDRTRLPAAFWVAVALVACTTAVEWSVTAWGATLIQERTRVSAATAVALMAAYFGGFLAGRVVGSRIVLRVGPTRLLGWALALSAIGFAVVWLSADPAPSTVGLALLGTGIGNLFPLALSASVAIAPDHAAQVSGRVVVASAGAVLLAPLTIGVLADATTLRAALLAVAALLGLAAACLARLHRSGQPQPRPA